MYFTYSSYNLSFVKKGDVMIDLQPSDPRVISGVSEPHHGVAMLSRLVTENCFCFVVCGARTLQEPTCNLEFQYYYREKFRKLASSHHDGKCKFYADKCTL